MNFVLVLDTVSLMNCARVAVVVMFGVFVWLTHGQVGLLPTALSGAQRVSDLERRFPVGKPIEVDVLEVHEDGRRIRLALKGVPREAAPPRAKPSRRKSRPPSPAPDQVAVSDAADAGTFGTSLGDALKAALEKPR